MYCGVKELDSAARWPWYEVSGDLLSRSSFHVILRTDGLDGSRTARGRAWQGWRPQHTWPPGAARVRRIALLLAAERERINELYRQGTFKDEARRRLERELDLREANLAGHRHEE